MQKWKSAANLTVPMSFIVVLSGYDSVSEAQPRKYKYRAYITASVDVIPASNIDIGCGVAYSCSYFANLTGHCSSIEINKNKIMHADSYEHDYDFLELGSGNVSRIIQ